ncbi:MAG: 2-hydroxyacyl-CoA dehydratase family protein [Desulfobacterales bacterium]|nr:2-hydroxyacyl-CoA dehydratase family protein [Desulfobacterales bacterium]
MKAIDRLDAHLNSRLPGLLEARAQGRKVIGYSAGGYMPEELVIACKAIPLGLVQAGDSDLLDAARSYICRWMDPFWRSQAGLLATGSDPYYNMLDLLVIPVTDNHCRLFSNTVQYYFPDVESFLFGVPHTKDASALAYYLSGIHRLRKKLEDFTGVKITDARLRDAIDLCNRERQLFREISRLRRDERLPFNSRDFVALHHGSFLADKTVMVDILEAFLKEAGSGGPDSETGPRILLTGSTLARGDSGVMAHIEAAGAAVVVEEFAEGLRPYRHRIKKEGDLLAALAEGYFMDRVCPGWFRPGTERLDLLIQLARDYDAAGLIWYQLMYRESYKVESYFFPQILEKVTGLKMLVLESEYDAMAPASMETRIETFLHTLRN